MAFEPEAFRTQHESLRALRHELAIKEKELAEQKWLNDQILLSPTWRLTLPLRWAANKFRNFVRSNMNGTFPNRENANHADQAKDVQSDANDRGRLTFKSYIAYQYRVWFETFLLSGAKLRFALSTHPKISLLLVLYNRAELTYACLRSVAECCGEETEVIIVDNASSDDTAKLLDRIEGASVIRNTSNVNFLLAVNQAARIARGENILLLNNDAQLLPGTIRSAMQTLQSAADIGAVGGKIVLLDGALQEAGSIVWQDGSCLGYGRGDDPLAPAYMFRRDVDYCSGAFLLTPRRIWEQLGGFDESYVPAYYEESDYCMRLWAGGLRVVYEPDAIILHYEFGSSVLSEQAIQLQVDHQHIFVEKHTAALRKQYTAGVANTLLARSRNAGERILFLDDRVPHIWLGSGFPRARTILLSLLKHGYFVTVYPLAEMNEAWDVVYEDLPREIEVTTGLGSAKLELFLRSRKHYYSHIVVSRPHNMRLLQSIIKANSDLFESVQVVYDAEALFARREAMLRQISGTPWSERETQEAVRKEIELTEAADCVVSVSDKESTIFSEHGIRNVHVIGHTIEVSPTETPFEERSGLLFVGAIHFESSPNGDSMIWFLTEVFPKIQIRLGSSICLTVVGVNKSSRIRELAGPSVHFTGRLAALDELYDKARLFVAPTRFAAGLPHKIHEAAARGLPVVTTPLLAEQLGWTSAELAIGHDAESFAERCVEYYTDQNKWMALRKAALERVRQDCSPELFDRNVQLALGERSASV